MSGWSRRFLDEDGIVAGGEALLLGTLVFVTGTLLLVSMWTIVDAKLAVESAARAAARAVVEAPAAVVAGAASADVAAQSIAESAAVASMTAQRGVPDTGGASWSLAGVGLRGRFERCGAIEAVVRVQVDTPRLPFIGRRLAAGELVGTHVERIEPYRAGLPLPPRGITC